MSVACGTMVTRHSCVPCSPWRPRAADGPGKTDVLSILYFVYCALRANRHVLHSTVRSTVRKSKGWVGCIEAQDQRPLSVLGQASLKPCGVHPDSTVRTIAVPSSLAEHLAGSLTTYVLYVLRALGPAVPNPHCAQFTQFIFRRSPKARPRSRNGPSLPSSAIHSACRTSLSIRTSRRLPFNPLPTASSSQLGLGLSRYGA